MAEEDKKTPSVRRISENQRYKYVGFDVAPGRIKDIFKSDAEKAKLVEKIRRKKEHRSDLGTLREECTLLEARVSLRDRIVLAVAVLLMVVALFLPWYSAYNETVEQPANEATVSDSLMTHDSLPADSAAVVAASRAAGGEYTDAPKEEVIHGYVARKKVHKEYSRLSGIGALAALGGVGSHVFSAGIILVVTGVLFLALTFSCVLLPAYTLFGLFGLKGNPDQKALKLKSILRLNWLPLALFVAASAISFLGADYGAGTAGLYTSIGDSYGIATFIGSLSWGLFVMLAASIMLAVKSIEI